MTGFFGVHGTLGPDQGIVAGNTGRFIQQQNTIDIQPFFPDGCLTHEFLEPEK